MTATNHMLTGVVIGFTVINPVLALPLAFASHFVLDSLPHFGYNDHTNKKFLMLLMAEAASLGAITFLFAITQPAGWQLAVACGLLAASPDFMWFPNWVRSMRGRALKEYRRFHHFHKIIQWSEKKNNWPYEAAWFGLCLLVLAKIL